MVDISNTERYFNVYLVCDGISDEVNIGMFRYFNFLNTGGICTSRFCSQSRRNSKLVKCLFHLMEYLNMYNVKKFRILCL